MPFGTAEHEESIVFYIYYVARAALSSIRMAISMATLFVCIAYAYVQFYIRHWLKHVDKRHVIWSVLWSNNVVPVHPPLTYPRSLPCAYNTHIHET